MKDHSNINAALVGHVSWFLPPQGGWFHEPWLGTFLRISCSFMFQECLGSPPSPPLLRVPQSASLAMVTVPGAVLEMMQPLRRVLTMWSLLRPPPSAWSPPPNMAKAFMYQVGLDPDTWEESKRLGPSTVSVVRCWTFRLSPHPLRSKPSCSLRKVRLRQ